MTATGRQSNEREKAPQLRRGGGAEEVGGSRKWWRLVSPLPLLSLTRLPLRPLRRVGEAVRPGEPGTSTLGSGFQLSQGHRQVSKPSDSPRTTCGAQSFVCPDLPTTMAPHGLDGPPLSVVASLDTQAFGGSEAHSKWVMESPEEPGSPDDPPFGTRPLVNVPPLRSPWKSREQQLRVPGRELSALQAALCPGMLVHTAGVVLSWQVRQLRCRRRKPFPQLLRGRAARDRSTSRNKEPFSQDTIPVPQDV